MEHLQTNGQVEVANKIILAGLRKRLEKAKGLWANELLVVLWAYHTTPHSLTQETSYRLVFGADAVIPIEILVPSPRIITMMEESNADARRAELVLLEEDRERARIRDKAIKQ